MAKKKFQESGFKGLNLGKAVPSDPVPPKKEATPPLPDRDGKNPYRKSKAGFERYTFMINSDFLPQIKDMAKTTGVDIKDVLNAAIEAYLTENWSQEKQAKLEALRKELGL